MTQTITPSFWQNKKVFLTGHTGFKGSWLATWLHKLGADVTGYALPPNTTPNLFSLNQIDQKIHSIFGDIRDAAQLTQAMQAAQPEIVIHMAAQPLVRYSYEHPVETYSTNVMGLVNVFEAIRATPSVRAALNVTSDKCYENREWAWGYREIEPLGGHDPYSSSKACAEIITSAYRRSYFSKDANPRQNVALASARAGNVIGGGDWSESRLIPDIFRAVSAKEKVIIRNPDSIRPWQHVLEPLHGYLMLVERLFANADSDFADAWNFGPPSSDAQSVLWIMQRLQDKWGMDLDFVIEQLDNAPHEAHLLSLDSTKAKTRLSWQSKWSLETTIEAICDWQRAYLDGISTWSTTLAQIEAYEKS